MIRGIMDPNELQEVIQIVRSASTKILEIYDQNFEVQYKQDESPVTLADKIAEETIIKGLVELFPEIPRIAEESFTHDTKLPAADSPFFLIDPLDGTKQFVNREGEFTINVALIEQRIPTMGIIHIPVTNTTYWTNGNNNAWRQLGDNEPEIIRCTRADPAALRVIMSKSHTNEETESYLESLAIRERVQAGSSLKFCRIAEGKADLYPRFGSIMEWDIAAGHAILSAAGGSVTEFDGRPILYGHKTFRTPYFLAKGILP